MCCELVRYYGVFRGVMMTGFSSTRQMQRNGSLILRQLPVALDDARGHTDPTKMVVYTRIAPIYSSSQVGFYIPAMKKEEIFD